MEWTNADRVSIRQIYQIIAEQYRVTGRGQETMEGFLWISLNNVKQLQVPRTKIFKPLVVITDQAVEGQEMNR